MQVNIKTLIDDRQCYETVRELRWPEGCQGCQCPFCDSKRVIKRGFNEKEPAKQRYECKDCGKRFDDLTGTIFAGHHQPLKVWILLPLFYGTELVQQADCPRTGPGPHRCAKDDHSTS
ncbi:IS1/IS1595 family N-terminal zinc-binding domain-containing protein [Desulfobacter hydrogenophilus]|uniref:IS1/IS1595 family N-terminal zinc-binding domain-containing protein n=1 Tax=Desulfobacter hydrogenophilus TaxID=2291 RepID=UPI001A9454F6|nr:transposase [Desulfobacter hydrogenophilus]